MCVQIPNFASRTASSIRMFGWKKRARIKRPAIGMVYYDLSKWSAFGSRAASHPRTSTMGHHIPYQGNNLERKMGGTDVDNLWPSKVNIVTSWATGYIENSKSPQLGVVKTNFDDTLAERANLPRL